MYCAYVGLAIFWTAMQQYMYFYMVQCFTLWIKGISGLPSPPPQKKQTNKQTKQQQQTKDTEKNIQQLSKGEDICIHRDLNLDCFYLATKEAYCLWVKPLLHIGGSDGGSWRFGIPPCSAEECVNTIFNPQSSVTHRSDPWGPRGTAMFNFLWRSWRFEMDRVHLRSQCRSPCKERQRPW